MLKTQVIGHIGADATLNNVNSKSVINFNVAHSESYSDANGIKVNKSVWLSCSYWVEKTAIAQYLKKGTQVYLEGIPSVDTYEREGKIIPQLRLRVSSIQLLGGNQSQQAPQPKQSSEQSFENKLGTHTTDFTNVNNITEPMNDLPF